MAVTTSCSRPSLATLSQTQPCLLFCVYEHIMPSIKLSYHSPRKHWFPPGISISYHVLPFDSYNCHEHKLTNTPNWSSHVSSSSYLTFSICCPPQLERIFCASYSPLWPHTAYHHLTVTIATSYSYHFMVYLTHLCHTATLRFDWNLMLYLPFCPGKHRQS